MASIKLVYSERNLEIANAIAEQNPGSAVHVDEPQTSRSRDITIEAQQLRIVRADIEKAVNSEVPDQDWRNVYSRVSGTLTARAGEIVVTESE